MKKALLLIGVALFVTACATQPAPAAYDPPGFFSGILHGIFAPFALVFSLISDTRIYAFPNTGWFYDLGFLLGIGCWGGGSAVAARC